MRDRPGQIAARADMEARRGGDTDLRARASARIGSLCMRMPMKKPRSDLDSLMSSEAFNLENRTAYRFAILSTLNMRCLAGMFTKKFKLSVAGWRVLSVIGRHETVFPGVVAELSTIDADKVTRAVDRLVEMGLVIRKTDSEDRRRVILRLSAKGQTVFNEIESTCRAIESELRGVLTAKEWDNFSKTLDKLDARSRELFVGPDAWKAIMNGAPATGTHAGSTGD
jgi:DNA-binding MarR family transcriptional regulator